MEVFLSWSGPRSRAVAEAFREWLPCVIQALRPFMSPDIEKGARWGGELGARLESARVGICCLTADNLRAPWLLFEAGAISKMKDSRACTFLLDLKPAEVEFPLAQFQATEFSSDEMFKLVAGLNQDLAKVGGAPLRDDLIKTSFDTYWPRLETTLKEIAQTKPAEKPRERSNEEKLDEMLALVRGLQDIVHGGHMAVAEAISDTGRRNPPVWRPAMEGIGSIGLESLGRGNANPELSGTGLFAAGTKSNDIPAGLSELVRLAELDRQRKNKKP